jgi:hypothetical protein
MRKGTQNETSMQYEIKLPSTVSKLLVLWPTLLCDKILRTKISDLFWTRIISVRNEYCQMFRNISWTVDSPFDRLLVMYKSVGHEEYKLASLLSDGWRQRSSILYHVRIHACLLRQEYKLKAFSIGC